MERIQRALRKQLIAADERLGVELRERSNESAQLKVKREQLGVDLYGFQQALAKLQLALESKHDTLAQVMQSREEAEQEVKVLQTTVAEQMDRRAQLLAKRAKSQKELDKVRLMLKQVEDFNQNLRSDIMVTRGAAYGTEEAMQKLEVAKVKQDERIAQLQEQFKSLTSQLSVVNAQIDAQKKETGIARRTLQEADAELQLIKLEKDEYTKRWRGSVAASERRHRALQTTRDELLVQTEKIRSLHTGIRALKTRIEEMRNETAKVDALRQSKQDSLVSLDAQMQSAATEQDAILDSYRKACQVLAELDAKLAAAQQMRKELEAQNEHMKREMEKHEQTRQQLDDEVMKLIDEQASVDKSAKVAHRALQQLKKEIKEKEAKMGEVQNEVARIKVDALNTNAHNVELTQTLQAYDQELKSKDKLIEKYEMEIRQRHDKIDKKQVYIARLNKKVEQLQANKEDEHTGPLEATIHNISKEIAQLNKENSERETTWIRNQKELVETVQKTETERAKVKVLESRCTVLQQMQQRFRNQFEAETKEIKVLKKQIRGLHTAMRKVNDLINVCCEQESQLANAVYCAEGEFAGKLKDLELDSVKMEGVIAKTRAEKEELLNEVVEVERQLLLWEKKIQLERETQAALDPEHGQPEIIAMTKEVHRMKLDIGMLKRKQEAMIVAMEKAIAKRETIQLSNMHLLLGKSKDPNAVTQAGARKAVQQLRQEVTKMVREMQGVEEQIAKQDQLMQYIDGELSHQRHLYERVENARLTTLDSIDDVRFQEKVTKDKIAVANRKARLFEDAAAHRLRVSVPKEKLTEEIDKQQQLNERIRTALGKLMEEHPRYAQWFKRLVELKQL